MADHNPSDCSSTSSVQPESTMEINIKTLDSQIYRFHAHKDMQVSAFKEKIAAQIGVPVEQQRLIFRGKVLMDTHLLSEYHLENGDTLHLVARQPSQEQASSSSNTGDATSNTNGRGQEPGLRAPRGRGAQISHSVVLGTFNVGEQGDGAVPDLSRVIGAVLNSIGVGNQAGTQPNVLFSSPIHNPQRTEMEGRRNDAGSQSQAENQSQPGDPLFGQSLPQVVQIPLGAAIAVPSFNTPIPDSLNTLSEFMSRMEMVLSQHAGNQPRQSPNDAVNIPRMELPSNHGVPAPDALGIVIRQAHRLISGPAVGALSHIAERLEQEASSSDPSVRGHIQTESVQVGLAVQHLGALFLELGRTILTLRMGQSPAESSVNAGPAVYISASGPNPIMVQPFPLQTSSLFSGSAANMIAPDPSAAVGIGNIPRHVNIHIHTGASIAPFGSGVGARTTTRETTQGEHVSGTAFGDSEQSQALPVRSIGVSAVPLGPAVIAVPGIISEANSRLRTFVDGMRNEHQGSSGQAESLPTQGQSTGFAAGNADSQRNISSRGAQPESEGSGSGYGVDAPDRSSNVPLGLGLGGLQPTTRHRLSTGQGQLSHSAAGNLDGLLTSLSAGDHNGDGELDVSNALSQALQNPAFSGLLAGVSQQTGIGSPNDLRNMLEQITQNPAMRNTVNQVAQQIDNHDLGNMFSGLGGGQAGGFDLSRMVQQMMPIVSQALGGISTGVPSGSSMQAAGLESSRSMRGVESFDKHSQQLERQQLAQRIVRQSSPGEMFSSLVRNVTELYDDGQDSIFNELCSENALARDFVEMLRYDILRRLQEDSGP